jgi:hypothetical protein
VPTNETRPAIGTTEAAVQSCVRLIASVAGQPEALVAYWLDLYYQVRCAYERENAPEPDPQIITRADLYPVMRELMQDALKSTVRSEAKDRLKKREKPEGERIATAPAGPRNDAEDGQSCAEILGPQTGVKGWAAKKAAIRDRLISARDQGVTAAQLVTASEQKISDDEIYAILNAAKADMDTYRRLEAALEALGR